MIKPVLIEKLNFSKSLEPYFPQSESLDYKEDNETFQFCWSKIMKSKSIFQSKSQIMSSHQKFVESFNLSLRYREMCVKSLL